VKAHAAILAAVERHDPDAAAERMREHLAEVSQVLVAQFAGIKVVG
jgi:DNA-binding GntR family transcriptional regulator